MKTVGAHEARTNLGKLLKGVMKGESVTITKHGVPVAVLQTPVSLRKEQPEKVISELKKFREKNTLGTLTIRELIEEGRK